VIWPEQRLSRIARLRVSNVDKLAHAGEIPVRLCNYVDVYKNDAITDDLGFMHATASSAQIASFRLTAGDTVFTKDSETADDIGVPAYVAEAGGDLVCGYHLAIATPDPTVVDPRFLFWAMSSRRVRDQWTVLAAGVTRVGLRSDDLGKAGIPVPPIEEQRRIADFLDTETVRLDSLVTTRSEQSTRVSERAQAVLDVTLGGLDASYGSLALRRELRAIQQGASPQCESRPAGPGEPGVLKLSAVNSGQYLEDENKALPEGVTGDRRYEVQSGDLLMSRANTPERVGDVALVRATRPGLLLPDLIYRLTLARPSDAEFVAIALRSTRVRALLSVTARGTSQSMVKLRGEDIAALPIPAAPQVERARAARAVREAEEAAHSLTNRISVGEALLRERRQALITAAVTRQFDATTASTAKL